MIIPWGISHNDSNKNGSGPAIDCGLYIMFLCDFLKICPDEIYQPKIEISRISPPSITELKSNGNSLPILKSENNQYVHIKLTKTNSGSDKKAQKRIGVDQTRTKLRDRASSLNVTEHSTKLLPDIKKAPSKEELLPIQSFEVTEKVVPILPPILPNSRDVIIDSDPPAKLISHQSRLIDLQTETKDSAVELNLENFSLDRKPESIHQKNDIDDSDTELMYENVFMNSKKNQNDDDGSETQNDDILSFYEVEPEVENTIQNKDFNVNSVGKINIDDKSKALLFNDICNSHSVEEVIEQKSKTEREAGPSQESEDLRANSKCLIVLNTKKLTQSINDESSDSDLEERPIFIINSGNRRFPTESESDDASFVEKTLHESFYPEDKILMIESLPQSEILDRQIEQTGTDIQLEPALEIISNERSISRPSTGFRKYPIPETEAQEEIALHLQKGDKAAKDPHEEEAAESWNRAKKANGIPFNSTEPGSRGRVEKKIPPKKDSV